MYYIVGLGNPGEEYKMSRHNTGRIIVENFHKKEKFKEFEFNKKLNALVSEGKIKKEKVQLIMPETFMNKSGLSVKQLITSKKKAEELIVIHDDIDLPFGKFKISFGKGSAGHRGVESVIKNIKTKNFARIRVGLSSKKKPPAKKIINFIIGNFKPKEFQVIKRTSNKINSSLEIIINEGLDKAMSIFN